VHGPRSGEMLEVKDTLSLMQIFTDILVCSLSIHSISALKSNTKVGTVCCRINVRGWRLRRTGGERENRFAIMQMLTNDKRLA
jgi:hypothetical protein